MIYLRPLYSGLLEVIDNSLSDALGIPEPEAQKTLNRKRL